MSGIQFFVPGKPAAQGSKRHVGHGVMVEMLKDLAPWRQAIAEYAKAEAKGEQLLGPLRLRAIFWFPRPASHFGTGRNQWNLKKRAPTYRDANPDLDKLLRALCDGLTASGVIRDDRYIVKVEAEKRYGTPGVLCNLQVIQDDLEQLQPPTSGGSSVLA
jgi:crossover junction endodeoxyribonuclease RusA